MTKALKSTTFYKFCGMKETYTEATREDVGAHRCMIWNRLESSHSTGRCGRHQNLIRLHKRILVLKCSMKERNHAVLQEDAF